MHGIVTDRAKVRGRKVAYVIARSTYFHEADSALFFKRMNDPRFMRGGPKSFYRAVKKMNFAFNWSYLDSKHIAYQLAGWYPRRARGTSPDFPVLGTGRFDWKGFDPGRHTADWLPQSAHPHAVDPPFLVSWNNKQAPGWAAADDQYAYSALHRSQMISDKVRAGTRGAAKMTLAELVRAMEKPATQDLRGYRLLPLLLRVIGKPGPGEVGDAMRTLRAWSRAGAHRRDLDGDGTYEHESAVVLMDAWWPLLVDGPVPAGARQAGVRAAALDARRRRPHAPLPQRARLLRRLVGLRPRRTCARCWARTSRRGAAPTAGAARASAAGALCAARSGRRSGSAASSSTASGDCDSDPGARLLRPQPLDGRLRDRDRLLPLPEPAHLPADRLDPPRDALTAPGNRPVPRRRGLVFTRISGTIGPSAGGIGRRRRQASPGTGPCYPSRSAQGPVCACLRLNSWSRDGLPFRYESEGR